MGRDPIFSRQRIHLRQVAAWVVFGVVFPAALFTAAQAQTLQVPQDTSATNSSATDMESLEVIDISGEARFSRENVRVGDTLSYVITVEWIHPKVPVTVLAPDSLEFSGFKKRGANTRHKKVASVEDGAPLIRNRTEFIYQLEALTPGTGKAEPARMTYFTGLSEEKEILTVEPGLITIAKAPTPWFPRYVLPLLVILLVLAARWGFKKKGIAFPKRKSKQAVGNPDWEASLKTLKDRLETGDSRDILLEMEKIAEQYVAQKQAARTASRKPRAENTGGDPKDKKETMWEAFLAEQSPENRTEWKKLREAFTFAKFGGGKKPAHELMDLHRTLSKLLPLKKEPADE